MIRWLTLALAIFALSAPAKADDQAFFAAAAAGDVAAVEAMLASGQVVDARNARGETALLIATHVDAPTVAAVLIEAGADVNAKDSIEDTPYLFAGAEGRTEILKLTLAHGAKLDDTNRFGGTALIPAAEKGHPDNVRLLLEAGVDPNHVNKLGWTAMLEAIVLTDGGPVHQRIVAMLIAGGADVNLPDGQGKTPLTLARERGFDEIAAMLEQAGAR